jgi:hypothetical protein
MNCQSFENIVSDLARDGLLDAEGLKHADECVACAERLLDERFLCASFRGIALGDVHLKASPATEVSLLSAFRSAQAETALAPNVTVFPAAKRRYHWSIAAAAAAVTVLFTVAGVRLLSSRTGVSPLAIPAPVAGVTEVPSHPSVTQLPSVEQPPGTIGINPGDNPISHPGKGSRPTSIASAERPANASLRGSPKNSGYQPPQPVAGSSDDGPREIATDFIPVSYSSALTSVEGGRVVRVELPRSALASFGLPMNMAEANGSVKADVLMDDYGTARAIRFVR